jgi:hypothetical protein
MPQPIKWIADFLVPPSNSPQTNNQLDSEIVTYSTGGFQIGLTEIVSATDLSASTRSYSVLGTANGGGAIIANAAFDEFQLSVDSGPDTGSTVYVWTQKDHATGAQDIYFSMSGSPRALANVGATTGIQQRPDVLVTSFGITYVTWEDLNTGKLTYELLSGAGSQLIAPTAVSSTNVTADLRYDLILPAGASPVAVYRTDNLDVKFAFLGSPEQDVDGVNVANGAEGAAALSGGGFVVVYLANFHINGRIFDSLGNAVTPVFDVITNTGGTPDLPKVAALDDGRFMVVAQRNNDIVAQIMNADGTKDGGEFTVNSVTTGTQSQPEIAQLVDGRVVVSWTTDENGNQDIKATIFDPRQSGIFLTGTGVDDSLLGTNFSDTIGGGFGRDTLYGLAGNDQLSGGPGIDTAVFAGLRAAYTLTNLGGGVVQSVGPDGTDTLHDIENFQFDDTTVTATPPPQAPFDFNGDGKSDFLWQNDNGQPAIWLISRTTVAATADVGTNPGPTWHVKDAGDFNADGKGDILWQNDNGQAAIWLMSGVMALAQSPVGSNPGPTWHEIAAADFNGDGLADILWQNDNGQPAIWLMNGLTPIVQTAAGGNPGASWHVKDAGDFNGDGLADILWQNDNGQAAIWLMNGTGVAEIAGIAGNPGPSWHQKAAADFNNDGFADILWQNDNGQAAIWLMTGGTPIAQMAVGSNPGPSWHVKDAGDYNGDRMADILWQNDNGQPAIWLMNGLNSITERAVGSSPGSDWHVS